MGRPSCRVGQALPSILFIFAPQAGQVPLAIRRPFVSVASPSKSRFPCISRSTLCRSRTLVVPFHQGLGRQPALTVLAEEAGMGGGGTVTTACRTGIARLPQQQC